VNERDAYAEFGAAIKRADKEHAAASKAAFIAYQAYRVDDFGGAIKRVDKEHAEAIKAAYDAYMKAAYDAYMECTVEATRWKNDASRRES